MIYKARTQTLDIKTHRRWKYDDNICVGCNTRQETIEKILSCTNLGDNNEETRSICCDWLISGSGRQMFILGTILAQRLKTREKLIEGITWWLEIGWPACVYFLSSRFIVCIDD